MSGRNLDAVLAVQGEARPHRSGMDGCGSEMARSKADVEAERELAVGLVIGCALDVQNANAPELVGGIAGLEKLLSAVKRLSQVFGWPNGEEGQDDDTRH